jgi:hypothetical protein
MRMRRSHLLIALTCCALWCAAGCEANKLPERPAMVPLDATLAASGQASISTLVYPGQAYYVTDDSRHALVFSSRVPNSNHGPVIVKVDRERKAILVSPTKEHDPELVLLENINPNDRYSIWLSGEGPANALGTTQRAGLY